MPIDFYHGHGSPFSWRVHLALEHKGLAYNLKVLSFQAQDTKKPEFLAINPRGQVPTIVDDGYAVWESMAILEFLDERYPQHKLYPGDVKERARVRRLADEISAYLYAEGVSVITDEYFWKGEAPPDAQKVSQGRDKVRGELAYLAKELRGSFLAGGEPSAADFVLYPCVAYCRRITFRKPEAKLDELVPASIAAWEKRIQAMPYYEKTYPPHWR